MNYFTVFVNEQLFYSFIRCGFVRKVAIDYVVSRNITNLSSFLPFRKVKAKLCTYVDL